MLSNILNNPGLGGLVGAGLAAKLICDRAKFKESDQLKYGTLFTSAAGVMASGIAGYGLHAVGLSNKAALLKGANFVTTSRSAQAAILGGVSSLGLIRWTNLEFHFKKNELSTREIFAAAAYFTTGAAIGFGLHRVYAKFGLSPQLGAALGATITAAYLRFLANVEFTEEHEWSSMGTDVELSRVVRLYGGLIAVGGAIGGALGSKQLLNFVAANRSAQAAIIGAVGNGVLIRFRGLTFAANDDWGWDGEGIQNKTRFGQYLAFGAVAGLGLQQVYARLGPCPAIGALGGGIWVLSRERDVRMQNNREKEGFYAKLAGCMLLGSLVGGLIPETVRVLRASLR